MLAIQKNLTASFFMLLSLPSTAMGTALSVQIAALSWILNTKFGFDLHQIGFVWMAGPLAGIIGQVLIGIVSDGVWVWGGRRRPFILVGGLLAALMLLALPNIDIIANTLNLEAVSNLLGFDEILLIALIVALTLDLSINISFNPTRSIIADVTPEGNVRTKGYTWMQTVSGFFGVVAYLIGAFINNYVLIYVGAVLVLVFSLVPPFLIQEPRNLIRQSDQPEQVSKPTNWTEFLKICLAHAFTWVGVQTMFIYTFSYIKEIIMGFPTTANLSEAQNNEIGFITGLAFALLSTVGFLLPSAVLEPLSEKIGRVRTHTLCIALMALGYVIMLLLGKTQTMFFVVMPIIGIGWAAVVSLPFAIMSETINQNRMGLFMGLFNLSVVLPQLVASQLGRFIDSAESKNMVFIISAITLGISAALWLTVRESQSVTKTRLSGGGGH